MREAAGVFGPKYRATRAPPWSDAPGPSAHTLVVRSVGQEDGSPQWRVVHEHTRQPTPVFMNTKKTNSNFHRDRPGHVGADHQHLNNIRQLPSTGRSMVGRCSTAKVDFGLLTPPPNFPLFMNKQRRLLRALGGGPDRSRGLSLGWCGPLAVEVTALDYA